MNDVMVFLEGKFFASRLNEMKLLCQMEVSYMVGIDSFFPDIEDIPNLVEEFSKLLRWKRGNVRVLLEEIKENFILCLMVIDNDVDALKVVPKLKREEYKRLLKIGFNFDKLSRSYWRKKTIKPNEELKGSDLEFFIGKGTEYVVDNIYGKIKELMLLYEIDKENPNIQWDRRIRNLHKRILILMGHLQGYSQR